MGEHCQCGNMADGLLDGYCQECWERLSSDMWWNCVIGIDKLMNNDKTDTKKMATQEQN